MSSLSYFPASSFKFDPFDSELEAPPPTTATLSQSTADMVARHLQTNLSQASFFTNQHTTSNGFPSSVFPRTWTYSTELGFIHTGSCSICTTYAEHVAMAKNNEERSIAEAMKIRRETQDLFFLDGYRLGLTQMMDENHSLRQELERVKRKYTTLEGDYKHLRISLADRSSPTSSPAARITPSLTGSAGARSSCSSSVSSLADYRMHGVTFTELEPLSMKREIYEENGVGNLPQQPVATYASVVSTLTSQNPPSNNQTPLSSNPSINPPPGHPPGPVPAFRLRRDKQGRLRFPKTIHELRDLMTIAGESTTDGAAALTVIKKMCLDAHATPRESKTSLQKWILMNWRNPYTIANANVSSADVKPNPRIDDPVEVWFDYLCHHPHSWPKGVRKDTNGKPFMTDLIANRAVARMRPTESASLRNDFIAQVTDMFASPGMYQHLLEKHKFTVAPQVSYNVFTGPVTVESVALHFARSGFTPADATNNFEPWAKHYKEC